MRKILKPLAAIFVCIGLFFYWGFARIPEGGTLIDTVASPRNDYTINVFLHENSLSADAIRCESVNNHNGSTRNIYWNYPEDAAEVKWISEEVVDINGIELNVNKDKYDFRWD